MCLSKGDQSKHFLLTRELLNFHIFYLFIKLSSLNFIAVTAVIRTALPSQSHKRVFNLSFMITIFTLKTIGKGRGNVIILGEIRNITSYYWVLFTMYIMYFVILLCCIMCTILKIPIF
jgi:hypothetical protein